MVRPSAFESLGMDPFGNTYYDPDNLAHKEFRVLCKDGAVVILRPDGLVGSAGRIDGP